MKYFYGLSRMRKINRRHKWVLPTIHLLQKLVPILLVLAFVNWFFNTYMVSVRFPVSIQLRSEQFQREIIFYNQYGPYLDPEWIRPTPTVEPTPVVPQLHSFDVPEDIKRLVLIFADRANVPPAFAMGILLTENRSFNANAVNLNYDGTQDHGLWQLNNIPEYDPIRNTERAADVLNSKRIHLAAMGIQDPSLGLLAESYNKGAAGAVSLLFDPSGYARKVLTNATMPVHDDPFVRDPFAYVRGYFQ